MGASTRKTRRRERNPGTRKRNRTVFKPGDPRINRRGRPAGSKNKFTGVLKNLILDAVENAHKAGAAGYLEDAAKKQPRSFLQLLGKLLPTKIGNEDAEPFQIETINRAQAGLSNLSDAELKQLQAILKKAGVLE